MSENQESHPKSCMPPPLPTYEYQPHPQSCMPPPLPTYEFKVEAPKIQHPEGCYREAPEQKPEKWAHHHDVSYINQCLIWLNMKKRRERIPFPFFKKNKLKKLKLLRIAVLLNIQAVVQASNAHDNAKQTTSS